MFRKALAAKMALCPISEEAMTRYQQRTAFLLKKEQDRIKKIVEERGGLPDKIEGMTVTCHEQQSSPAYVQLHEKLDAFVEGKMEPNAIIPGDCDAGSFTPQGAERSGCASTRPAARHLVASRCRGRKPPALAGKPTCVVRLFGRAAQRLDGGVVRARQRRSQSRLSFGVAAACASDDAHPGRKTNRIARALARNHKERAPKVGVGERNEQPAPVRLQRIEPRERKMRDAGVDDDRVDRLLGSEAKAVPGDDSGLRPGAGEVRARPLGETGIDLDRGHLAVRPDDLGENGAVIAQAGADMDDAVAGREPSWSKRAAHRLGCPLLSRRVSSMATSTSWQRRRGSESSVVQ